MRMHRILGYLLIGGLLVTSYSPCQGQPKVIQDVGVMAGTSWYFGDLNPEVLFYQPSPAVGVFYRPNFNKRYALRTSLYVGGIRASGANSADPLVLSTAVPFQHSFLDLSTQFEFNFLPYSTHPRKVIQSPYVTAGVAYSWMFGASPAGRFVLPFGLGWKINLSTRLDAGIEWGFRKTFDDAIDGFENLINPNDKSFLHNNDWYSIVGIFVSYKIFYYRQKCAAYW